jgi:uncharacterized protein
MRKMKFAIAALLALAAPMAASSGPYEDYYVELLAGDFAKSREILAPLVKKGYVEATYELGIMVRDGEGGTPDQAEYLRMMQLAADGGYALAMYNLGHAYRDGRGRSRDPAMARMWYERCAVSGFSACMGVLGQFYALGLGGAADPKKAEYWLARARDFDDSQVARAISQLRGQKKISPAQESAGIAVLQKQAETGDAAAQLAMANYYLFDVPTGRDLKQARFWIEKSATGGNSVAQRRMGVMMRDGNGGTKDIKAAYDWFRKSAAQGDSHALALTGGALATGTGASENALRGYQLLTLAIMKGDKAAMELRMLVGEKISASDYDATELLTRRCLKEGISVCGILDGV